MISAGEFRTIVSELLDELPEAFFRELTGGVIVSETSAVPPYARGNDICTMGLYKVYAGVRQIIVYKGSFDRVYPHAGLEEARSILRGILRHEFRHHLEFLGGNHSSASLEAEDERKKQAYLARHADDAAAKAGPDRPKA